jgi:SpoVK/Ycf46/Vps4 family AAA+-type ATPase
VLTQDSRNAAALTLLQRCSAAMAAPGLPDKEAHAEIVRIHLRERPVAGIDLKSIAGRTDGFTGADLAHVCDTATQLPWRTLRARARSVRFR